MVPKSDRLTVQEILIDKIFFHRALHRHHSYLKARAELEQLNVKKAREIAEFAGKRYGFNRKLLTVLIETYVQENNAQAIERVQKELQTLLDSRLF
jgi:uncharacterized protein YqgQ